MVSRPAPVVFLVDVDNTLLDNDRIRSDIREHLAREHGESTRDRYWEIQERLFVERGYRDYLGAIGECWPDQPPHRSATAFHAYLVDYPFADRLYPRALDVLEHLLAFGPTVVLTDGDAVFQPRKVERAGIRAAVSDNVLVYVHKEQELDDVERRHPGERYVVIDDKPQILAAAKQHWGERVTTILPVQGQFANDAELRAAHPAPDVAVRRIGDLLELDLPTLVASARRLV